VAYYKFTVRAYTYRNRQTRLLTGSSLLMPMTFTGVKRLAESVCVCVSVCTIKPKQLKLQSLNLPSQILAHQLILAGRINIVAAVEKNQVFLFFSSC